MLRHLGCQLPIQLWYLGRNEITDQMKQLVSRFGVECVDGAPLIGECQAIKSELVKKGWILKSVAMAGCPFAEVMFLDADNLPIRDPSFLFETPQYKTTGAIFWPDSSMFAHKSIWRVFRVPPREEPEFESGQAVIDKRVNWEALSLAEQINRHANIFYRLIWGDKDTFRFAWHKLGRSFAMPDFPPQALQAAVSNGDMLCQHDFEGGRLFQHRIMYKWNLFESNPWISGFFLENECRAFLEELRSVWNGRCGNSVFESRLVDQSPVRQNLLKTVWLLKLPRQLQKKIVAPKNVQADNVDESATWIELRFDKKGTLRKRKDESVEDRIAGIFWDLRQSKGGWLLTLSGEDGQRVKLRQAQVGWRGHWTVAGSQGDASMLALHDVYPHLKNQRTTLPNSDSIRKIRQHFSDKVHVKVSFDAIGDHIVGAFACTGLARMGVPVVFHSFKADWLARINEPGLVITSQMPKRAVHVLHYDCGNEVRYGLSRALWYAGGLHPLLKPAEPQVDRTQMMNRLPFKHYVLLSPIARYPWREWPQIHWTRLAHLLREVGFEVVAIGRESDQERLQDIFATTQAYWVAGHPPAWVTDAMLGAAAYIGLDSGMTHLAALLRVRAVAIHSQMNPEFLWPKGAVKSVAPDARCVFCRWQCDRGWLSSCQKSCSALDSVRPETVLDAVLRLIKNGDDLMPPLQSLVSYPEMSLKQNAASVMVTARKLDLPQIGHHA
jgi:hypothetical protein